MLPKADWFDFLFCSHSLNVSTPILLNVLKHRVLPTFVLRSRVSCCTVVTAWCWSLVQSPLPLCICQMGCAIQRHLTQYVVGYVSVV